MQYKPMLAQPYDKHKHKLNYYTGVGIQPKLNGVRCIVELDHGEIKFWSRAGKPFQDFPIIRESLFANAFSDRMILDGELYVHGQTFQHIVSGVKATNDITPTLKYNIYDTIMEGTYYERYFWMEKFYSEVTPLVLTETCPDIEHLDRYHLRNVEAGYEGSMIRDFSAQYDIGKRSMSLLKRKDWYDKEYKIVGALCGTGKDEGCILFRCVTEDGKEFISRPAWTYYRMKRAWNEYFTHPEAFIGKMLTVKYFFFTEDGAPMPSIGVEVRDYE